MYTIQNKDQLLEFASSHWNEINGYLDHQHSIYPIPLYSSVDIRESKTKFAPVDHNIYPAGFNNLCSVDLNAASLVFGKALRDVKDGAKTIGIIPESHTKNTFYLDNIALLGKTIRDAGFDVYFMSFDDSLFTEQESLKLISHSNFDIEIHKAKIKDNQIILEDKLIIDIGLLNNDQSHPIDIDWKKINTPVVPTPYIGWFKRNKIQHFKYYQQVVESFCDNFSIDPNLLQAKFTYVDEIDFSSKEGFNKLANEVEKIQATLPENNKIFIKAGQGTYGMGINVVSNKEDILKMNRKLRNKMDVGKNKKKFTSVVIQEGVDTILKYDNDPAEVAIYLVDGISIGGFMRVNGQKDSLSNLNSRGMVFRKFCISEIRQNQEHKAKEAVYSIVARLATIASGLEIKDVL